MSSEGPRVSTEWLALREPADAAARDRGLVARLRSLPSAGSRWLIHDLGGGTGSMGRWLAPRLDGPQHWVVHDRDADLLELATTNPPRRSADGAQVSVETNLADITTLRPERLAGTSLITASALLDMLTEDELTRLVTLCTAVGCPVLLTLSVVGRVTLDPAEPIDRRVAAAFDAHQRRVTERGQLLGPDAAGRALEHFERLPREVLVRPSPWRLGPAHAALAAEWFTGWIAAAREQEVALTTETEAYVERRLAQVAAGRLAVTVDHVDVLVLPAEGWSISTR